MEQLDELIFSIIESLRNNKTQTNEDTRYATINKDQNKHQLPWKIKRTINYFIRKENF